LKTSWHCLDEGEPDLPRLSIPKPDRGACYERQAEQFAAKGKPDVDVQGQSQSTTRKSKRQTGPKPAEHLPGMLGALGAQLRERTLRSAKNC
jgi:hypothetical protein